MNKFFTLLAVFLLTATTFAQAPQKMSYQAVVRDSDANLVSGQQVGMQISILQGSTAVYVETQTPTTNTNGLVSIAIGTGIVVSGTFAAINWSSGAYNIQTDIDPTGPLTNYTITGTSQLMSVPYALYAKTAENVTNDAVNDADSDPNNEIELPSGGQDGQILTIIGGVPTWVNSPCIVKVGDTYAGGIVFYVDASGCHGLVAAPSDQSAGAKWGCNGFLLSGADGVLLGTGNQNTIDIVSGCETETAAYICANLTLNAYSDWFLPSKDELNLMYENIGQGNVLGLGNVGDFASANYWSSSEKNFGVAWFQYFTNLNNSGFQGGGSKNSLKPFRAVRAF